MLTNMTTIQMTWAIYFAGALGCVIATWWMFLWAWRFIRYSAVALVATILLTPHAIDPQTMTMAPSIYTIVFEGVAQGFKSVQPMIKVMVGIWLILEIIIIVFLLLTRKPSYSAPRFTDTSQRYPKTSRKKKRGHSYRPENYAHRDASKGLSREEYQARSEIMGDEIPIRAIRD